MDNFTAIIKRVTQKKADYAEYSFERLEMAALNTFFDLAQEYDGLKNLYLISVTVPQVFFGMQSILYLIDTETQAITVEASSQIGFVQDQEEVPEHITITNKAYQQAWSPLFPRLILILIDMAVTGRYFLPALTLRENSDVLPWLSVAVALIQVPGDTRARAAVNLPLAFGIALPK